MYPFGSSTRRLGLEPISGLELGIPRVHTHHQCQQGIFHSAFGPRTDIWPRDRHSRGAHVGSHIQKIRQRNPAETPLVILIKKQHKTKKKKKNAKKNAPLRRFWYFGNFGTRNAFCRFFSETLDQERAQVPHWGPAPVSGATFLRLG